MPRYIDAEAFKLKTQVEMTEEKSLKPTDANFHNFLDAIYSLIARGVDEMPAADVVERKKGKWINDDGLYRCSSCDRLWAHWWASAMPGEKVYKELKYCPNCGADMREEKADEH